MFSQLKNIHRERILTIINYQTNIIKINNSLKLFLFCNVTRNITEYRISLY